MTLCIGVSYDDYASYFNKTSTTYVNTIEVTIHALKGAFDAFSNELTLQSDLGILTIEHVKMLGVRLLEVAISLQDLYAHTKEFESAIAVSSTATKLILQLSKDLSNFNFSENSKKNYKLVMKGFRSLPQKVRYLTSKLLAIDGQLTKKLLNERIVDDRKNLHQLVEASRRIYNLQTFASYEMCEIADELISSTSPDREIAISVEGLLRKSVDGLIAAASLCASLLGILPFDFADPTCVSSIGSLISLPNDHKTPFACLTEYSTFFTDGECEDEGCEDDLLERIHGAYTTAGMLLQSHSQRLLINDNTNNCNLVLSTIYSFYNAGVTLMYTAVIPTSSSTESKEEIYERAIRMFETAKAKSEHYLHIFTCSKDIFILFGDISYHLSYVYLKVYQLHADRSSTLEYASKEASIALEKYCEGKACVDTPDMSTTSYLDELSGMCSVDKRSNPLRYRLQLTHCLLAACAKESRTDSDQMNQELEHVRRLYKGPVEDPDKEVLEAVKMIDMLIIPKKKVIKDEINYFHEGKTHNVKDDSKSRWVWQAYDFGAGPTKMLQNVAFALQDVMLYRSLINIVIVASLCMLGMFYILCYLPRTSFHPWLSFLHSSS